MKILVTGAAGFLGFALATKAAENETDEVVCVDNFMRGQKDAPYERLSALPNVTAIEMDLTNQAAVQELPDDVDLILHMAALNGTQNFYERPFEVIRSCTLPTIFLLEKYGQLRRLKRFVYAGTSEAYASTVTRFSWPVPTSEEVPLCVDDTANPRWSYGASKMHGEIATIQGCQSKGVPFSIIRFHNAYGPRMGDKHVVPDFLNRAREGRYELFGYEDTRSFIYVDDAVTASLLVARTKSCENQTVNVGGTREVTMLQLAETLMTVCGMRGEIQLHPSPKGSVKRRVPDITKLKMLTGYQESWTLEDGLRETAAYYLS